MAKSSPRAQVAAVRLLKEELFGKGRQGASRLTHARRVARGICETLGIEIIDPKLLPSGANLESEDWAEVERDAETLSCLAASYKLDAQARERAKGGVGE